MFDRLVNHWKNLETVSGINGITFPSRLARLTRTALSHVLGVCLTPAILYEYNLNSRLCTAIEPKVPVQLRAGTSADLDLCRFLFPSEKVQIFENRLQANLTWVLGFVESRLAYSSWITFTDELDTETGSIIKPTEGEAYLFDSFTIPLFRGLGLHTFMTAQQLNIARSMGAQRAITLILADNLIARKAILKLGFQEREYCMTVNLWNRRFMHLHKFNRKWSETEPLRVDYSLSEGFK